MKTKFLISCKLLLLASAILYVSCRKIVPEKESENTQAGDLVKKKRAGNRVMDAANYPLQTPGYYWVIGTNAANDKIEIYAPNVQDWNTSNALKWSFSPTTALGWTSAQVSLWDFPRNVRFRNVSAMGGECIAATADRMALIASYPSGIRKWSVDIGVDKVPQSVEILPNGNFAIAAAGGNWIRVYASSQGANNSTYGQYDLNDARAVLWDPTKSLLWALGKIPGQGNYYMVALTVGGTAANPTLTENTSYRTQLPGSGPGRDIAPFIGDANKFWISCEGGLYIFNKSAKTFTAAPGPANQSQISSAGSQTHGQIIVSKKDGLCVNSCWSTSTINFYSTTALVASRTKTGARFMSMHPCNPNYEFQTEYRFATYNIRSSNIVEDPLYPQRKWENRYTYVVDMIRKYNFDIFGTQEAWDVQLTNLNDELGPYDHFGPSVEGSTDAAHDNIFYKKWRFGLLTSGTFWLAPGGPTTPTGPSWGANLKRICTWGKFKDLYTGEEFYVFNTHYDNQSDSAKRESSNLLLSKIPSIAGTSPVILMGDFNASQKGTPYKTLHDSQLLDDAFKTANINYSYRTTTTGWNPNRPLTDTLRIDHIFKTSHWSVKSHNVLTDTYNGVDSVLPSDHYPVLIEVKKN